ncbi:MAG: hypothetical protein H8E78_01985 [Proteobacteria bacterium]|nr:hypothetical protein [Pseudomonadota bacterium]
MIRALRKTARPIGGRGWAAAALLLFAALFSGCTGAVSSALPFQPLDPPPDHRARLVLYRADKLASLASTRITLDGRELGRFSNHEYESILLTPGTHVIRAGLRGFGFLAWGWNSLRFRVVEGETTYLEISVRLAGRNNPAGRELEIAGRPSGVASANVFIALRSAKIALPRLERTTRLSRTKTHPD